MTPARPPPEPGSPEPYVAAIETHTGAVLLVGELAYKVKKPVSVGFLDWTRRADRVRAIEDELTLNRRLAPDVYLRTGARPSGRRDVSDADAAVATALAVSFEPWPEAEVISTATSTEASLDAALAAVEPG